MKLDEILSASRVHEYATAVVATLAERYPEIEVKRHPGKLDIADVVAENIFRTPSIAVAMTRLLAEQRGSGAEDVTVDVVAYVIVEDKLMGEARGVVYRDELGWAICQAMLGLLNESVAPRWGLNDISAPDHADAKPIFTSKSFARGTAYYAVTWKQTLLATTPTIWDMGSNPPL